MQNIERIDENMRLLEELFKDPDEVILKGHTRKQLDDIYDKVYSVKQPSYLCTKSDVLKSLYHYYHSVRRADALSVMGARRWN